MFVEITDFDALEYSIPKVNDYGSSINAFIEKMEEKRLRELIGNDLYDLFIEGLEDLPGEYSATVATVINQQYCYGLDIWKALTVTTGTLPVEGSDWELVEEDNQWLVLRDGITFEVNGKKHVWAGMNNMLVPIVYAEILEATQRKNTGIGLTTSKAENAIIIESVHDIVRGNNDYVRFAKTLFTFFDNSENYPELDWCEPEFRNIYGI